MAKALAYNRAAQQAVVVDTVNNRFDALGAVFATADTTNAFPGRSENIVAVFKGDEYFLYRTNANAIALGKFSGGVWSTVGTFPAIAASGGTLTPLALWVDRGFIIATVNRSGSGASDGTIPLWSLDGATWTTGAIIPVPVSPTPSQGGHSIVWRNTLFFAHSAGIGWTSPVFGTQAAAFDTGSDGGLAHPGTPLGHFAFWNGSLYFARFSTVPVLYQLTPSWDPSAPTAPPAWTKLTATGLPAVGVVASGPDVNTLLLFESRAGNLCLAYSGQLGTKLAQATQSSFPAFSDVTTAMLPAPFPTSSDLGFGIFTDDRRRVNELQTIFIRDVPGNDTILANWDGVSPFVIRTTFTGLQLMAPDERFGELRTYTALQPACFITNVAQPFPGRAVISYTVRDSASRPVDVFGEYSIDGDEWFPMTEGDGDDGNSQLTSSPVGTAHTFFWDTFTNLDGDYPFMFMRIVARISGV